MAPRIIQSRLPDVTRQLMVDMAGLERSELAEVEALLRAGMAGELMFEDVDRLAELGIAGSVPLEQAALAYETLTGRKVRTGKWQRH